MQLILYSPGIRVIHRWRQWYSLANNKQMPICENISRSTGVAHWQFCNSRERINLPPSVFQRPPWPVVPWLDSNILRWAHWILDQGPAHRRYNWQKLYLRHMQWAVWWIATFNVVSETTMARCAMVGLWHEKALLPLLGRAWWSWTSASGTRAPPLPGWEAVLASKRTCSSTRWSE